MIQSFEELERDFGNWVGNPNCVAVSSGTSALHLALEAFEMPEDSYVVVPDYSMVACARAVVMAGMQPLFVDCSQDLLLNPYAIEDIWTSMWEPHAVMAVHTYGRICDMDAIQSRNGSCKYVIEDLAEAHGVKPHPQTDAACWSFYKNKVVHGEEGGMITFRDPKHAHIARELRSLGFSPQHDFNHRPRGVNARMSNLHAIPILKSLKKMEDNLYYRRTVAALYDALINPDWIMPQRAVNWVYDFRVPGMTAEKQAEVVSCLNNLGIAARHGFKPMTNQKEFYRRDAAGFHPNTYQAAHEFIYLPITEYMTPRDVTSNIRHLMFAM